MHDKANEYTLPQRAALGCGFCTHCFQGDLHGFLKHLIEHYDNDGYTSDDWSVTKKVQSLLMQSHVLPVWYMVCEYRLQTPANQWPTMKWTLQNAGFYIDKLEHDIDEAELYACLPDLLEIGLAGGCQTSKSMMNHDAQSNEVQFSTAAAETYSHTWTHPPMWPAPIVDGQEEPQRLTIDTAVVDAMGQADVTSTSSITLADDDNVFKYLQASKDTGMIPPVNGVGGNLGPSFSPSINLSLGGSGDKHLEGGAAIGTFFDPAFNLIDMDAGEAQPFGLVEEAILPDFDKINSNDVSSAHSNAFDDNIMLSSPSSYPPAEHADDSTGWPSHANFEDRTAGQLVLPFNPTPHVQYQKGHRGSISGSIWRALQSIPSFPSFH